MYQVSLILLSIFVMISSACSTTYQSETGIKEQPIEKRSFNPVIGDKWIGNGISYSPYRDGEGPDTEGLTSKAHILEDLTIIAQRWNLIRLYGADPQHRRILEVIPSY